MHIVHVNFDDWRVELLPLPQNQQYNHQSNTTEDMACKLYIIPFHSLEKAFEASHVNLEEQREYNTDTHTLEEITTALPQVTHILPSAMEPFLLLEPWLDLIMSSQELSHLDIHQIELPKPFISQMLLASQIALFRGYISDCNAEDLAELFPRKTTSGVDIDSLLREGEYFARLDTCSLKDTLIGGKGPIRDSKDLWTCLATSNRGATGIRATRNNLPESPVYLFLIKWNENMRTELEYRVFCAPGSGRVAAISQYKWHERWFHANESIERQNEIAKRVIDGTRTIHRQIEAHPAMTEELRERR
ncbi:MAG: hypothetical protein L6R40_000133 [Gallowayella cf. fulva]|nr:MAG: hypothetical protein L6R40_000133 [Xanthomendoza cf. fulva]